MDNYDLVLDDGKIWVREYTIKKSMSLTEFAKQLVQVEKVVETPQLPPNCVKFRSDGKTNEYFIHIPMGSYNVKYRGKEYVVTFPHQVMYFKFSSTDLTKTSTSTIKMFWSYEDVIDIENKEFCKPAISNYGSGFCMGPVKSARTQAALINNWIESYFENEFNDDISSGKRSVSAVSKDQEKHYKADKDDNEKELALLWIASASMSFTKRRTLNDFLQNGDD